MAEDSGLIEDCKQIYVELSFNARWTRIAMFHLIGKRIIEEEDLNSDILAKIARNLGVDVTDIATAVVLADKYPDLDSAPYGKDISWDQVKKELSEEKIK